MVSLAAQTAANNAEQSWTVTTVVKGTGSPVRKTEKYSKSGTKTLYTEHVEQLGPDGYQPSYDIEKETVREDATTTRSTARRYSPDGSGRKQLVEATEEETKHLSNGESTVVRTTSNPTPEGDLRIVKREVAKTRTTGPGSQQTETSIYLADSGDGISGNLAPVWQTQEEQKRSGNDLTKTSTTKLADFGSGGFKLAEVTENTVKQDGENRTAEESASRPDFEGNLSEVSRTVVHERQSHGQSVETAETYSLDVPGRTRDGQLHLVQRVTTTVRGADAGRTTTEQQIEQIDPDGLALKVMTRVSDVVTSGPAGTEETRTTSVRNPDGNFTVTSTEEVKSDQPPGIPPQSSPSNQ